MTIKRQFQVRFTRSAQKEYDKLPAKIKDRVIEALSFLSQNPYTDLLQIKKLKGSEDLFRIRIGEYRIVYTIQNQELVVIIVKIGHRREVYRR